LKDVGGVDSGAETRVHAKLDHPPQSPAMAVEQLGQGPVITLAKSVDQDRVFIRSLIVHCFHISYLRANAK
jgi:hypothetical protein